MLNDIIKGIAMTLRNTFGAGYKVYVKDVEQGLKEPCFFVMPLQPEYSPLLNRRRLKRNPFDIQYFPKCPGDNPEMYDVAEKLLFNLEFLTLPNGNSIRGTSIRYEITDDVLHFFINYNHTMILPVEETPMETLDLNAGLES